MIDLNIKFIEDHMKHLEERIKTLAKSSGFVGYHDSQPRHTTSGLTLPDLVGILSAGYSPGNLPPRPVFQYAYQTFQFKDSAMKKDLTRYLSNIKGKKAPISVKTINEHWCSEMSQEVLQIFGSTPPLAKNAESTIDKKGGINSPLEDTGELSDNLGYAINGELPLKLYKTLG